MRYTPDTETPPAQPSAGVSGQKGVGVSRGLTAHFWAPVVKAEVAKAPLTKPWRLLICPVSNRVRAPETSLSSLHAPSFVLFILL